MASLDSLIRLGKWQLDEKRRLLGEIYAERRALEAQAEALEEQLRREQDLASSDPAFGYNYAAFAQWVISERERYARLFVEIDGRIDEANEEVMEAYRDLKKYEITAENRAREEAEVRARAEQAELDELSIEMLTRNKL